MRCASISLDIVFDALLDVYFYQNKRMQLMSMDKYFSWDAQFPFLVVYDFLRDMNIFSQCVNFCEV